jgi:hypothetical protein
MTERETPDAGRFRHLGDAHLRRELERDRRAERWLWAKAAIALAVVAAIIVVRQVFFP